MKVVAYIDKPKSAIARLTESIVKQNPHLDIRIVPLHPKRADKNEIMNALRAFEEADLVFLAYWRCGEVLKNHIDIREKPVICWHHNPYQI